MAAVHRDVLVTVLPQAIKQGEIEETLKKAAQFFSESIAPFEMTFRGFHDSINECYNMNKILEQSEMNSAQWYRQQMTRLFQARLMETSFHGTNAQKLSLAIPKGKYLVNPSPS